MDDATINHMKGMMADAADIYNPESAPDADLASPDFENATRVHDWRNYIGAKTRALWASFTPEQRRAIAMDAADLAGAEDWD